MKKKILVLGILLGIFFLIILIKPVVSPVKPPTPQWQTYRNEKFNFQFDYPIDWQKEEWDLEEATGYKTLTDGTILYQGKFFGENGHFEILIWQNKSGISARNYLTWYRHEDLNLKDLPLVENDKQSFSSNKIASLSALRYFQSKNGRGKPVLYYFFNHDDHLYELTEEREDLNEKTATLGAKLISPIYSPILKSFRFLDK